MFRKFAPAAAVLALALVATAPPGYEEETTRYFITQDDCGGNDNYRMDTNVGGYNGGCAFLAGPANEALGPATGEYLVDSFPQGDGATYLLDGDGEVSGQITTIGTLGSGSTVGLITLDVTVTAMKAGGGGFYTLIDETIELEPVVGDEVVFTFSADIDDTLDMVEIGSMNTDIVVRGVNAHTHFDTGGESWIDIDHLVEVPTEG